MGGRSSEHEISVASARSVVEGLREAGYDPVPIEISREGRWALPSAQAALDSRAGSPATRIGRRALRRPAAPMAGDDTAPFGAVDVVFPVLHGPFGEDGTVQGLLELADVAYVGPGVAASALAMDKDLFKAVMRDKRHPGDAKRHRARRARATGSSSPFELPVVIKPARLGSSVGITLARTADELARGSIWLSSTTRRC